MVAGDRPQTGLLVEHGVEPLGGHPRVPAQDGRDHGRVQVPGASSHHQARQGGVAHRRVVGGAVLDRRHRRAVAQVRHHAAEPLARDAQELRRLTRHPVVGRAVEPVAADPPPLVELLRHGVAPHVLGHGAVERGVEHADLRQVRPRLLDGPQAQDGGGVVQGSQRDQPLDVADDLVGREHRRGEALAAVDHAVARGVDRAPLQLGLEPLREQLERLRVVRDPRAADVLDQPGGQHRPAVRTGLELPDLVLQRGRAAVDDEHEHGGLPGAVATGMGTGTVRAVGRWVTCPAPGSR